MHPTTHILFLTLLSAYLTTAAEPPFVPYSSSFTYPSPPVIHAEFTANFMQQKYDTDFRNHITAGFAYFSPSARKVRADSSNGPTDTLTASLFDFTNVTKPGASVVNTIVAFPVGAVRSQVSCSSFLQNPGFPLFTPDILNTTQAAFIGTQHDALHGPLDAWQFSLPPNVLVTVFVDNNNTLMRYDFSAPGDSLRTFATTRFFNVVVGTVNPEVFETDCP